ncbi:MAG: hypothetical protein GY788_01220 [bacterium]|nr:hypothetical protein [bacterium]
MLVGWIRNRICEGPGDVEAAAEKSVCPPESPERAPAQQPGHDEAVAIVYASLLQMWDSEADRFWTRNNLLLLINGALLGLFGTFEAPRLITVLACAFGIYFSWLWMFLNKKGEYYVARWRPTIVEYEAFLASELGTPPLALTSVGADAEVFRNLPSTVRGRISRATGLSYPRQETSKTMQLIILGFVVAWLGLGAAALVESPEGEVEPAGVVTDGDSDSVDETVPPVVSEAETDGAEDLDESGELDNGAPADSIDEVVPSSVADSSAGENDDG